MNNRTSRKLIAEDTLKILETGYFITPSGKQIEIAEIQEKAENGTIVYRPATSDELLQNRTFQALDQPTEITVIKQTTLNATRALIEEGYEDALCLNFASAKNPGGGFLGGSQAQEESIARSTGLYNCQIKSQDYYQANKSQKSCMYTDYMIYSPNVPIIKNEGGKNLEKLVSCAIITAPAVNAGVVKKREAHRIHEIPAIMKRRIKKVLAIALNHNHSAVVLGAWGCGVFQNDPNEIASYFKEILDAEFKNRFRKIVFAIYSRNEKFIKPFQKAFDYNKDA